MYNFILNMWRIGRMTEAEVRASVTKLYITAEQAETILATPQAGV